MNRPASPEGDVQGTPRSRRIKVDDGSLVALFPVEEVSIGQFLLAVMEKKFFALEAIWNNRTVEDTEHCRRAASRGRAWIEQYPVSPWSDKLKGLALCCPHTGYPAELISGIREGKAMLFGLEPPEEQAADTIVVAGKRQPCATCALWEKRGYIITSHSRAASPTRMDIDFYPAKTIVHEAVNRQLDKAGAREHGQGQRQLKEEAPQAPRGRQPTRGRSHTRVRPPMRNPSPTWGRSPPRYRLRTRCRSPMRTALPTWGRSPSRRGPPTQRQSKASGRLNSLLLARRMDAVVLKVEQAFQRDHQTVQPELQEVFKVPQGAIEAPRAHGAPQGNQMLRERFQQAERVRGQQALGTAMEQLEARFRSQQEQRIEIMKKKLIAEHEARLELLEEFEKKFMGGGSS